jgi:aryl-alcohol dehydrogenase-like predicted oxidoreductase
MGFSMAELSLAWVLAQPGITSEIVGARDPQQLRANLGAAEIDLPADILHELDVATSKLKLHFGNNADMWDNEENSRIR